MMSIVLSCVAILISLVSLYWSIYTFVSTKKNEQSKQANQEIDEIYTDEEQDYILNLLDYYKGKETIISKSLLKESINKKARKIQQSMDALLCKYARMEEQIRQRQISLSNVDRDVIRYQARLLRPLKPSIYRYMWRHRNYPYYQMANSFFKRFFREWFDEEV